MEPNTEASYDIVSISATSRPGNYTAKALAVVNAELEAQHRKPVVYDARELTLSFPGEEPTPDARRLRSSIEACAGVVLATPEYHGGFSAMTKLIIENLGFPSSLAGKPIALVGVAAGRIGAIKSLEQLRGICAHVGALAIPGAVSIAGVQKAFDAEGNCIDADVEAALEGAATSLLEFIRSYVCPRYALEAMVREQGEAGPWVSTW